MATTPIASITIPAASIKGEIVPDNEVPQLVFTAADNETDALAQCEAILQKYGDAAWESAAAIAEIIDRRLYKTVGYSRFADYCSERLGVHRQTAYRLRQSHEFMKAISAQTQAPEPEAMPDTVDDDDPAQNVSATRHSVQESTPEATAMMAAISPSAAAELVSLPAETAAAVVAELSAEAIANGEAITMRAARKKAKEAAAKKKAEEEAKAAAAAEAAKPVLSEAMQEVERALENGVHGQKVLQQIRNAMKALRDLPPLHGLDIVTSRKDSILRHLESAANALSGYLPAMPCPKCEGKKCPDCGNMGWLNKSAQRSINHQR